MKTTIALAGLAALGLAACGERATGTAPQGSDVAAAMPDTSVPRDPNAALTTPDAGATGTVPADGSAPKVAPTPPQGTAGGLPADRPPEPGKN